MDSEKKAKKTGEKKAIHAKEHKPMKQAVQKKAASGKKVPAAAHEAREGKKSTHKAKETLEKKKKPADKKILKIKELLKRKKHPVFRGRFGGRWKRRKSIAKWNKWHYPRGIDIIFKQEDGANPKIGYRVPNAIRFLHPSGYPEVIVSTQRQLAQFAGQKVAVRFAARIGKRKRAIMLKKADELDLKVLNRWKK